MIINFPHERESSSLRGADCRSRTNVSQHKADGVFFRANRLVDVTSHPGRLAAKTSTFSITNDCASSSDAFAIGAVATRPERWAACLIRQGNEDAEG
jgi:hypothetical protein